MKRSWYSDMQRLGRESGWGMRDVIAFMREAAQTRAIERMKTIEGEPEELFGGERFVYTPIIHKRTGKRLAYRVEQKPRGEA